jgi:hypothetical protein
VEGRSTSQSIFCDKSKFPSTAILAAANWRHERRQRKPIRRKHPEGQIYSSDPETPTLTDVRIYKDPSKYKDWGEIGPDYAARFVQMLEKNGLTTRIRGQRDRDSVTVWDSNK